MGTLTGRPLEDVPKVLGPQAGGNGVKVHELRPGHAACGLGALLSLGCGVHRCWEVVAEGYRGCAACTREGRERREGDKGEREVEKKGPRDVPSLSVGRSRGRIPWPCSAHTRKRGEERENKGPRDV